MDLLGQAIDEAVAGAGRAVLLTGEAGVGKSRTSAAVTAAAEERGMTVLTGRAVRAVTPAPLRPLSQAVLSWLRANELPDTPELNAFRPALGRLAPQLAPADADRSSAEQATSLVLLGEGLLRLLTTIGGGDGVVLHVEDLHWADPETMVVLEYLADNLADSPVVLLTTTRPLPAPAQESMESLATRGALTMLTLAPFEDGAIEEMVRGCLGGDAPAEVSTFIRANAGGLPLLVEELLTGLATDGTLAQVGDDWRVDGPIAASVPQTFARTVQQRLGALPLEAQRVARAAALLGGGFDWSVLPVALEYDDVTVLDALRLLVAKQIVVSTAEGFDFRHALTREAVRAAMLPPEQAELAQRLSAGLAAPGTTADNAGIAELQELAGDPGGAARTWLLGAQAALGRGALATAREMLDRGLRLVPADSDTGLSLREVLVDVVSLAGDAAAGLRIGRELLEDLRSGGGEPARLAVVRLRMARSAWSSGRLDEAEDLLAGAAGYDEAGAAVLRAGIALGRFRHEEALTHARHALEVVGDDSPGVACEAWELIGRTERGHDVLRAEEAYEQGFRIAERHDLGHWRSRMLTELAALDTVARRPTEDRLLAARAVALETGAVATAAQIDWYLNIVRLRNHDVDGALTIVNASIEQMQRLQLPLLGPAYLLRGFAHGLAGKFDEMEADIAAGLAVDPTNIVLIAGEHAHTRAPVALAYARYEEARSEFALAMTWYRKHPGQLFTLRGAWALLETVLGDGPEAGDAARAEVRDGEQATTPATWFALRYADAVAAGRAGDGEAAARIFADAEWAMPGREPWIELHLRALVATAAARDGWGDPVTWFRQALDGMVEIGQTEAASATRAAMRDAGIPVPRKSKGPQRVPAHLQRIGVTAREYDVLELAVEGLTNAAIAERLFLSARTVEVHVGRLLQRTGSASRAELAAHLVEPD
ncbi:LuxR family transcriptional regulator [Nocardioides marmoriginsengisoli]|uniref:LuxR family transcriptional regulator n=2 Tax=Nocardioides marmoriginsengisoli TaxID=661483 RepID=A0A3N0CF87_9ACTN|nr:LuxR family transcriptional regulator [Nocardioides marmoriginsengisoli]